MKKFLLIVTLVAFAVSCVSQNHNTDNKMNKERLVYFSYDHHNSMAMFSGEKYNVSIMKDGRVHVVIDEGFPEEMEFYLNDSTIFDELLEIVKTYKMDKYKSDYKPDMDIFDGDSWSLYYKYDTKRSVSSGGYMAWPKNYHEMRRALSDYFKKWREYQDGVLAMDYFKFTIKDNKGRDEEYTIERGETEATVILRNKEEGIDTTIKVSNDYLMELQRTANSVRLKSSHYDYHTNDENATRCTFSVRYNTGEIFEGYTCYTQYQGQKESALYDFFLKMKNDISE